MFKSPVQTYFAHPSPSQAMEDIVAGPEITMSATGLKGDQKPRKMRASCDACSRAKVKCDKIRPTCQRCGNMSICCNYSPSMRLGKPRKHRNPDGSIKREVSPAGSYRSLGNRVELIPRTLYNYESSPEPSDPFYFGPRTPECHFQDAFVTNTLNGSRSPAFSEGAGSVVSVWSNSENMMFGDQMHMFAPVPQYLPQHTAYHGHVRSTSSQSQPDMYASLDTQQPSPDASQQFLGVPNDIFVSEEKAITPSPPMVPAPLPTPPASIEKSTHNCTSFAFQILNSLYTPPETRHFGEFTSATDGSPTLESVLSANKAAVERLYALLDCDCTSDPHFSAVIDLSITKILSWYQDIARVHCQRRFLSSEIKTEPLPQQAIGPGSLESEAESTYRTNIVLSELPKIEKLIDRFSKRYCRAGNEAETGIGSGVYLSMEASLRVSVRETFKITMSAAPEAIRRQMASRTKNRMRVNTV